KRSPLPVLNCLSCDTQYKIPYPLVLLQNMKIHHNELGTHFECLDHECHVVDHRNTSKSQCQHSYSFELEQHMNHIPNTELEYSHHDMPQLSQHSLQNADDHSTNNSVQN